MLSGFSTSNSFHVVTHLQFADDTIIFCGASLKQVVALKKNLRWFRMLSGLKINYGKCDLIGIHLEDNNNQLLANAFGCRVGQFPEKYLGIPNKILWDPVTERLEKRLSSWKGKYLSLGDRVTLIKSILSRIPIYFLSCFRCPTSGSEIREDPT